MEFDKAKVQGRLDDFWNLKGNFFGMNRSMNFFHIEHLVRDRLTLSHGFNLLNDEMNLAPAPVGADFSQPSVMTTVAHTMCGDRIQQASTRASYADTVGSRFAFKTRKGEIKPERFFPAGGGTADGKTLAHVTYAHAIEPAIEKRFFGENDSSYFLVNFDLEGHFGRHDAEDGKIVYGKIAESPFRAPRPSCGAICGCLAHPDENNTDHRRIMRQMGDKNFKYLRNNKIQTEDGVDITPIVGSAIVCIAGVYETINGLVTELAVRSEDCQQRSLGHFTASLTENRVGQDDFTMYLMRATLFDGEIKMQGFGTDATKYSGKFVEHKNGTRLMLTYDGKALDEFPIETVAYDLKAAPPL